MEKDLAQSDLPSKRNVPNTIQRYHIGGKWYFRMVFGTFLSLGRSVWAFAISISFSFGYILIINCWIDIYIKIYPKLKYIEIAKALRCPDFLVNWKQHKMLTMNLMQKTEWTWWKIDCAMAPFLSGHWVTSCGQIGWESNQSTPL